MPTTPTNIFDKLHLWCAQNRFPCRCPRGGWGWFNQCASPSQVDGSRAVSVLAMAIYGHLWPSMAYGWSASYKGYPSLESDYDHNLPSYDSLSSNTLTARPGNVKSWGTTHNHGGSNRSFHMAMTVKTATTTWHTQTTIQPIGVNET